MMIKYDYRYGSITPDDIRALRRHDHDLESTMAIMAILDSALSTCQQVDEIRNIANRPMPEPFDLDYATSARDNAKARHDTPVVKLWDQEIWRLKLELTERNDKRRIPQNDGRSGHHHD